LKFYPLLLFSSPRSVTRYVTRSVARSVTRSFAQPLTQFRFSYGYSLPFSFFLTLIMLSSFLITTKIFRGQDTAAQEALYTEKFANPLPAAQRGFIDDIIHPQETRHLICQDLLMLRDKRIFYCVLFIYSLSRPTVSKREKSISIVRLFLIFPHGFNPVAQVQRN
jgi:Carboxyl transferase domain